MSTETSLRPWTARFGLSQRERMTVSGTEAYRTALERTLRSRMIYRLEKQIASSIDDPTVIYEALKVYLMLGGKAPKADNEFIVAWMVNDWEQDLYKGAANKAGRDELETHLRAMLELDDGYEPQIELNGSLVDSAQQALVRLSLADRAYSLIKSEASSAGLSDWLMVDAGQGDTALVFETSDGTPLEELRVDGLYTYAGFHTYFLEQLGMVAEKLLAETWVLGKVGEQAAVEKQFSLLGRSLLELYRRDFVAQWDGVLAKLRLKRMSADKPQYLSIAAASSANSPIRNLFLSIAAETTLTKEPDADPSCAGSARGRARRRGPRQGAGKNCHPAGARPGHRLDAHRHRSCAEEITEAAWRGRRQNGRPCPARRLRPISALTICWWKERPASCRWTS